jgi:hypothetical protein
MINSIISNITTKSRKFTIATYGGDNSQLCCKFFAIVISDDDRDHIGHHYHHYYHYHHHNHNHVILVVLVCVCVCVWIG